MAVHKAPVSGTLTPEQTQALVAALPHEDLFLLANAAKAFADQLDAADKLQSAEVLRRDAAYLRNLSESLFNANHIRRFIEEKS